MNRRLLWIALAVSLALNLSFVGVWGYSAVTANETIDQGNELIDQVADHLLLSAEQRDGLIVVRRNARERWRTLSSGGNALRQAVINGLADPVYDEDAMRDVVSGRLGQRAAVIAAIMGDLHAYVATLSPDQRDAFIGLAGQRGFLRGLFGARRKPSKAE